MMGSSKEYIIIMLLYLFHSTRITAETMKAVLDKDNQNEPEGNNVNHHPSYISLCVNGVQFISFYVRTHT